MRDSATGDITSEDLQPLIEALSATRSGSQFLLRAALEVLVTPGVGGRVTIHIPRKPEDRLEVEFSASAITEKGG